MPESEALFYTPLAVLVILDPAMGTGAMIAYDLLANPPFGAAQ